MQRLLGPAEAEIGCDACFDELDRYVDLQLLGHDADAAVPGMRAHLDGCPACREDHESLHTLACSSRLSLDVTGARRERCGAGTGRLAELAEDVGHVAVDRVLAEE